jgi:glycosyltransferase involved in cell wall biosynthesis
MKDLMAQADVIVCPYRGEGFNLCMLEAMASGRAAIATKWSGPLDFGTDDTVYWLEPVNKEPAQNDAGIQIGPSVEDLVKKMIWCVNHQAEVRERGRRASRMMHEKWTWERKVQEVLPYLRELAPNCRL